MSGEVMAVWLAACAGALVAGYWYGSARGGARWKDRMRRAEEVTRNLREVHAAERAAAAKAERDRLAEWKATTLKKSSNQLKAIEGAKLERRALLNKSEFRVFAVLHRWLREQQRAGRHERYGLYPQVCLGEVLSSPDDDAFASINSKRCDMLLTGPGGFPVATIEYQGEGHDQGDAVGRDAVKRAALAAAAVSMVEIYPGDDHAVIVAKVETGIAEAHRERARRKAAYQASKRRG